LLQVSAQKPALRVFPSAQWHGLDFDLDNEKLVGKAASQQLESAHCLSSANTSQQCSPSSTLPLGLMLTMVKLDELKSAPSLS